MEWKSCAWIGPQKLFLRGFAFQTADHIVKCQQTNSTFRHLIVFLHTWKTPPIPFILYLISRCPHMAYVDNALLLPHNAACSFIIHIQNIHKETVLRSRHWQNTHQVRDQPLRLPWESSVTWTSSQWHLGTKWFLASVGLRPDFGLSSSQFCKVQSLSISVLQVLVYLSPASVQ